MKKCSQCGENNQPDKNICQKCGATLNNSADSQSKEEPLIIETPATNNNKKKRAKKTNPSWNQSQWEKEPDYEQTVNKKLQVESVELDLSDEEDEQEKPTRIEKKEVLPVRENYEEKITVQNPIQANAEESPIPPEEPAKSVEPKTEYNIKYNEYDQGESPSGNDNPEENDNPKEKEKKKKELEAMLKKKMEPAHRSKGIAYIHKKNCIRVAGGAKLAPGQEIRIGQQDYILKPAEKKKFPFLYVGIAILAILIFTFFQINNIQKVRDSGQIIGYIYDQDSKMRLADAVIGLKGLDKKVEVTTDKSGYFKLDLIPPGVYDLEISLAGFQTAQNFAVVRKKQDTFVPAIGLSSREISEPIVDEKKSATKSTKSTSPQTQYGKIRIKTDVPQAIVLVDNKMVGKGSGTYSDIPTGRHTIRVTAEGYQDWAKKVRVNAGRTSMLNVSLSKIKYVEQISATDYLQAAKEAYSQENYDKALENYIKAVRADSKDGNAYLGRGLTYLKLGLNKKAKNDLTTAAKLFRDKKDYAQTVKCYDALLQINPDDPDLYYYRGICYLKTKEYEKSIQDFEKATDMKSKFFWGYLQLSYAYYKAGNYEESIKSAKKAKKVNPHDRKVYVRLAEAYLALGDKTQTKENYNKFVELTTLVDREKMKQDPEWKKVLQALNISHQAEF